MKFALTIGLAVGAVVFLALILREGVDDVLAAVSVAGWSILFVVLAHGPVLVARGLSLRVLLDRDPRLSTGVLTWIWWIGESVNNLLPVAQIGGEVVRARLIVRAGLPAAEAAATVIVGLTAGKLMLAVFASLGIVALAVVLAVDTDGMAVQLAVAITAFGTLVLGFYCVQRSGLFLRLARLSERLAGGRKWAALSNGAASLDRAIAALYRKHGRFVAACLWRLGAFLAGVGELWLTLYLLGHPVSPAAALVLESLSIAVRKAGFFIPAALGLQEGSYLVLGALIGLPGPVALSAALVKRFREIVLGAPGLLAWQAIERKEFLGRRNLRT